MSGGLTRYQFLTGLMGLRAGQHIKLDGEADGIGGKRPEFSLVNSQDSDAQSSVAVKELSPPSFSVLNTQVTAQDKTALVRVRRDKPTYYSISMRWVATDNRSSFFGIKRPAANQSGEFVFDWDMDEILIPVDLGRGLSSNEEIKVMIEGLRCYGVKPVFSPNTGIVSQTQTAPLEATVGTKTRIWNEPVKRNINSAWRRDFYSDLVNDFHCNASGYDPEGKPCFMNQLPGGRAQLTNGEVGLYSDPTLHQTAPLQLLDGKRILVAEKLQTPVVIKSSNITKICTYSSPIISTERNALLGYGRFEYKFALLGMQEGCWPAGWSICLPHWRWPNCEQDTVEISFNKPNFADVFPYTTNHWGESGTSGLQEGQFDNVFDLIPNFKYADTHTYWHEWTPEQVIWGIDDTLLFSVPNRFFLGNRADTADPNRVIMLLQIALGGAGGDCSKGVYPLAPSSYTRGSPAMQVEYIAHYAYPH